MKFKVKNLAKIKKAEFDIKDLTIFVGKNSTNKTYAAHTVYMLNKLLPQEEKFDFFNEKPTNLFTNFYKKKGKDLIKILEKATKNEKLKEIKNSSLISKEQIIRMVTLTIDNSELKKIVNSINKYILEYILKQINNSFNSEKNTILEFIDINFTPKINTISITNNKKEQDNLLFLKEIFIQVYNSYEQLKINNKEYYFPASRTGFVLAFDEIVSGVLRDRFGGQPTATKLTEPTIDFISNFSSIKSGNFYDNFEDLFENNSKKSKTINQLLEFIEKRVIKGKILEEKSSHNYTKIFLEANSKKLDLHLSSSAAVEVLPLIIFLKHFSTLKDKLLVIEEPEAHLHPQAQIEMARLLIMLVNAGAKVLITTHSDYILNEISNCIKLAEADSKGVENYLNAYGLNKDIIINKERVSAYLFKDTDDSVEVKELGIDKYGIFNDNFDDVLDELLDRTEEINKYIDLKSN